MTHLLAFTATLALVFLKALQQRNVAFDNYAWVMPTSMGLAAAETFVIVQVASNGWQFSLVLALGMGGGIGAIAAMKIHHNFIKKEKP